jgi:hypothetical protein
LKDTKADEALDFEMMFVDEYGNPAFFFETRAIPSNEPKDHIISSEVGREGEEDPGVAIVPRCFQTENIGTYVCSISFKIVGEYRLSSVLFEENG